MNAVTATITDEDRILPLRDAASASGVSERTLRVRLQQQGIPILAVTPRKIGVRLADYHRFLKACEA